jgi:hypothetical protein
MNKLLTKLTAGFRKRKSLNETCSFAAFCELADPLLHFGPGSSSMTTRVRALSILSLAGTLTLGTARTDAQVALNAAVQVGDFRVAVSNYYHVPEREVVVVHDRRIRDEELPVVFFMAQHARVAPAVIVDLRLRGMSWWSISTRYHIGPEVYYVPVAVTPGPPYGKAYGHYKKSRNQWNTIVLADDDVVNMVHLRFLSDYYHVAPEKVIEVRAHNTSFVAVQQEVSHGKGNDKKSDKDDDKKGSNSQGSNGRGRGRGGV